MNLIYSYYFVKIYYSRRIEGIRNSRMTAHVIRASSKKDCLRIQRTYGISCPRFSSSIVDVRCAKLNNTSAVIKRRRRGVGGNIWYEENWMLKSEEVENKYGDKYPISREAVTKQIKINITMKKSVIVIFVPSRSSQEEKDFLDENLQKMKDSDLHEGFDILYIEDPAREKAEVEVFFNPFQ